MDSQPASAAAVLSYWFAADGGSDASVNYRTKWFASRTGGRQAAVDAQIRAEFGATLRCAEAGELEGWRSTARGALALVVVLDQFSRHVYRDVVDATTRVEANDALALSISLALLDQLEADASPSSAPPLPLSVAQCVFALMPLRHTPTEARLQRVARWIARLDDFNASRDDDAAADLELMTRFRRATTRELEGVLDRATPFSRLTADASRDATDAAILEHGAFAADESELLCHPLASSMRRFLRARLASSTTCRAAVAISLSGGVDSMVIAKIAACLRDSGLAEPTSSSRKGARKGRGRRAAAAVADGGSDSAACSNGEHGEQHGEQRGASAPTFDVVAVHIDYGNRAESGAEAAYVERWCASLGVHFRQRRIDEVKRGVTERSAYERIARTARFDAYRAAIAEFGSGTGVIFGHHRGDVQENVISNVMKGGSLLNAAGLTGVGTVEGVEIWRPLLLHPKRDILQFAHRYGVPYFRDTTPRWSTRGKLRNRLVPLLQDMYGDGVLEKLSSIATQSRELRGLVDAQIFAPFRAGIKRSPLGVWAHCAPFASQPHFFWAEMLREMCHGSGYSMVKTRAVDSFLERLRPEPGQHYKATTLAQFPRNGWIPLKKGQRSLLRDGTLYIFAPALFAEDDAPLVPAIPAASASALAGTAAFASAAAPTPPQVHHLRCGAWGLAIAVQRAPENYTNAFPPPPLESLLIGTSFEYAVDLDVAAPPPCAQRRRLEGGAEDVRDRATALTIVLARGAAKDGPVSKARWKPWRKLIPPQLLAALPIVRVISAGNAAQASAAVEDGTCCVELPWSALVAAAVADGAGGGGGGALHAGVRLSLVVRARYVG